MQTLRKRNSPCKYKNEPTRFLGEGVSFKAKLIGILEVSEARGDRTCQAALADLKMAIRAAGEHKQRITVQISIDGLRLRDEKTGDCQYHHPVHKISFIAQDMNDSRAFGYIFGSPDMGHRFFGIKTEKAASQVVFELKKKEIELAKQHIEQSALKFPVSGIYVESSPDTKGAASSESSHHRTNSEVEKSAGRKYGSQNGVVDDLLDLQFELNSLQQGIHQMDKITPDNSRTNDDFFDADPFGDSFANMKVKENVQPILPPPPSSKRGHLERQQTVQPTSASSSPITTVTSKTPPPCGSLHWFDKKTDLSKDEKSSNPNKKTTDDKDEDDEPRRTRNYSKTSQQVDVFTELDPLGTGSKKPYIDKKDFFQHLKNPPKKVLKDLATVASSDTFPTDFKTDPIEPVKIQNNTLNFEPFEDDSFANFEKFNESETSPRTSSPLLGKELMRNNYQSLSVSLPPEEESQRNSSSPNPNTSILTRMGESTESTQGLIKLPSPKKYKQYSKKDYSDKSFPIDFSGMSDSLASPLKSASSDVNPKLSSFSAETNNVPEPPPRGSGNVLINPPPLPPKKQNARGAIKPPPRPPYSEGHFHYDFLEREENSPSSMRKERNRSPEKPTENCFDDNFSHPLPQLPKKSEHSAFSDSSFEDSFSSIIPPSLSSFFQTSAPSKITTTIIEANKPKPSLNITLSQLTSSNLGELAASLSMSVAQLTNLTLQQLTECLMKKNAEETKISQKSATPMEEPVPNRSRTSEETTETSFVSNEARFETSLNRELRSSDSLYDKYAVFRELLETENQRGDNKSESVKCDPELENQEKTKLSYEKEFEEIDKVEDVTSLKDQTVKLLSVFESADKDELMPDDGKMRSSLADTKIETIVSGVSREKAEVNDLSRDSSKDSEECVEQDDQNQEGGEILKDDKFKVSDKKGASSSETESLPEKMEIKQSASASSDKYAALREIIKESEQMTTRMKSESTNSLSSPQRTSSSRSSLPQTSLIENSPVKTSVKSSTEVDLMSLFSDSFPQPSMEPYKQDEAGGMDIFEEIKMLNMESHAASSKSVIIPKDVFLLVTRSKQSRERNRDEENWAKFDTNVFQSRKTHESHCSVGGTSPWSPDGKEYYKEVSGRLSLRRNSGGSDSEWKDEEESEESNSVRYRGEVRAYGRPFHGMGYKDKPYHEEGLETGEKDRSSREKMGRKTRGISWSKAGQKSRDQTPWYDDSRWAEERKKYMYRKAPYQDEEEYKAYWRNRSKQRAWNGEREEFWQHDDPYYEDEREKKRFMLWNEEKDGREGRDRFSSQESMGYGDEERWSRREYERRGWDENGSSWSRRGPDGSEYLHKEVFKEHDPYYERDARHYDYPLEWEEVYRLERADDSPRYVSRKRYWSRRPNSANDGRNPESIFADVRPKYPVSRSECSDNDSDPYHRPHRSRSRDSYWGSDQEFDSWGERPCRSEGGETTGESFHKKRINRHRTRPQMKSQSSPFEDDFTQLMDKDEACLDSSSGELRNQVDPELKPSSSSPRSTEEQEKGGSRTHKGSSYFKDELTLRVSPSGEVSDRPRPDSDVKATSEELPTDIKGPDGFISEDSGRDNFFNGDQRFDDDAFKFQSEMEDQVPDKSTMPFKSNKSNKYGNNNKIKGDQHIKKSDSINIFARENDPFDDDEFFN